jgi:acetyl esterase/lipase
MVIVFPGGGYNGRAEHERMPIAAWLNAAGFSSAVLDYRTQYHNSPLPLAKGPLRDAQRAIRLVRYHASEWGVRPDRIAILGFSAGGHLAGLAGTHFDAGSRANRDPVERESCRPDAMVLCYGALLRHKVTNVNLLGAKATAKQLAFYSCEKHVTRKTPPAFLWHTADDEMVPVANSLVMAQALQQAGVSAELHVFPKGRHGLGLAQGDPLVGQWTRLCEGWLRAQGF